MLARPFREFHDGVYVVTVPRYRERQKNVTAELGEGSFEFAYSLDRSEVTLAELIADGTYDEKRSIEIHRRSSSMRPGQICCAVGHRNVYQQMEERGIERAMIFEDDVTILDDDNDRIQAAIESVPADAELVYWGWTLGEKVPAIAGLKQTFYKVARRLGMHKYTDVMIDNLYSREFNEHLRVAGRHNCTHAYTITLSGARKIIARNTPIVQTSDNALQYAVLKGDLRAYISIQKFFGQRSMDESDPLVSLTSD